MKYCALVISILLFFSCNLNPEPETYLIPSGFKGRVVVIFKQKNGSPRKYENGRRIYEIPENGISMSQFTPEYGIVDHQYFYVGHDGKRQLLPIYKYKNNADGTTTPIVNDKNAVGVFSDGTTGQYGEGNMYPFQFFFVSSLNDLDRIEPNDNFDNRVKKTLQP